MLYGLFPADAPIEIVAVGGCVAFVIDGGFYGSDEKFDRLNWMRLSDGYSLKARTGKASASLWVKTGHLVGLA